MTRWLPILSLITLLAIPFALNAQSDSDSLLLYVTEDRTADASAMTEFVYVFDAATGENTLLHEGPSNMDRHVGWSPDGRYVWIAAGDSGEPQSLRLYDATTGDERTLADDLEANGCYAEIDWSPTGKHLVYTSSGADTERLTLVDVASGDQYLFETRRSVWQTHWMPNQDAVLFTYGAGSDLLVSLSDGTVIREFEGYVESVSQDGRYIALFDFALLNRMGQGLQIYDVATAEMVRLESETNGLYWWWLTFSPDGQTFTYRGFDDTPLLKIYNIQTDDIQTVELNSERNWSFESWSREGRYAFYRYFSDTGPIFVFHGVVDVKTGIFSPVDLGEQIWLRSWVDTDEMTALMTDSLNKPNQRLILYNVETDEVSLIFETPGTIFATANHEDWIAITYTEDFVEMQPGRDRVGTHIWISDGDTTIQQPLTVNHGIYDHPNALAFSESGRWIKFDTEDGIHLFDTQDATFERIPLDTPASTFGTFTQFWSPDERYLTLETSPTRYGSADDNVVVWDTETDSVVYEFEPYTKLIGWQGSPRQQNLRDCGIG